MKFDAVIHEEEYTVTFDVNGRGRDSEIENLTVCKLGTEDEAEGVYECLTPGDLRQLESEAWDAYEKHCAEMQDEGDYN